jgi:hypothetical protein
LEGKDILEFSKAYGMGGDCIEQSQDCVLMYEYPQNLKKHSQLLLEHVLYQFHSHAYVWCSVMFGRTICAGNAIGIGLIKGFTISTHFEVQDGANSRYIHMYSM